MLNPLVKSQNTPALGRRPRSERKTETYGVDGVNVRPIAETVGAGILDPIAYLATNLVSSPNSDHAKTAQQRALQS